MLAGWSGPVGFQKEHDVTHYERHYSVIQLHVSLKPIQVDPWSNFQRLIFACVIPVLKKTELENLVVNLSEKPLSLKTQLFKKYKNNRTFKAFENKPRSYTECEVKTKSHGPRLSQMIGSYCLYFL